VSNVVDLEARRIERTPHRSGFARCLNCKYEWVAVAPVGTCSLECSQCATMQGVFKGLSTTEHAQWQCACSEWTFYIDVHGPYCAHCGIRPQFDAIPRPSP
jgi:hypothetical protein